MRQTRIAYIDIVKGLLILCLLYGHMIIELNIHGIDDKVLHGMWKLVPVYNSFFMPCFFLITGLCTTFGIPFRKYLVKNLKTLILPAVAITLIGQYGTDIFNARKISFDHIVDLATWIGTGGPWFIISLFIAKLIYWGASRMTRLHAGIIIGLLYFGGLLLNKLELFPNYLWHRHAMTLLPYLFIGDLLKDNMAKVETYFGLAALAWLFLVPLQVVLHYRGIMFLPMHDKFINVSFDNFIVHFINVMLGTAMIFYVSKWIERHGKSGILQTFGKGTLLIYLINEPEQRFVLRILMPFYSADFSPLQSFAFQIAAHLFCFILFYIVVRIVYESKYLSVLVGKW